MSRVEEIYGRRPGEILDCDHACQGAGCGTTEHCTTCGAARAIASVERGCSAVEECRILQKCGKALDLRITSTPILIGDGVYTILSLTDISHEKRRAAMERIFFHDLLNTAGGVVGHAQLISAVAPHEVPAVAEIIQTLSRQLVEEIQSQRNLVAAEEDDLHLRWEPVSTSAVLSDLAATYSQHEAAKNRTLRIDPASPDISFCSDRTLLLRVLGNMAKNALEASEPGQTVTVACRADRQTVEFRVHNQACMPRTVQLQVFQRSFSTKGSGRGLGTYSMKLLGEKYLKGRIDFTTSPTDGTVFRAVFPRGC